MAQPAYKKAWADRNRETVRVKNNAWNKAHPESMRAASARYEKAHSAKVRARKNEWNRKNPEKARARSLEWSRNNPDRKKAFGEVYRRENVAKIRAYDANRRAKSERATPSWANEFFMDEAYRLARLRTKLFGYEWHVDHIVPLQSKFVCGLHVHNNLRVIPGSENKAKGNRSWRDMA